MLTIASFKPKRFPIFVGLAARTKSRFIEGRGVLLKVHQSIYQKGSKNNQIFYLWYRASISHWAIADWENSLARLVGGVCLGLVVLLLRIFGFMYCVVGSCGWSNRIVVGVRGPSFKSEIC